MRKKIAMRKGGKVAKYAEGGEVFDYEAMLADAGVPGFERRAAPRRARQEPSLITSNPVGSNRARGLTPVGQRRRPAPDVMPADAMAQGLNPGRSQNVGLPTPPMPPELPARASPRARQATTTTRRRSREMTADELNEREMTRILNERSLEAAGAGRNMYRKGGRVSAKKK